MTRGVGGQVEVADVRVVGDVAGEAAEHRGVDRVRHELVATDEEHRVVLEPAVHPLEVELHRELVATGPVVLVVPPRGRVEDDLLPGLDAEPAAHLGRPRRPSSGRWKTSLRG